VPVRRVIRLDATLFDDDPVLAVPYVSAAGAVAMAFDDHHPGSIPVTIVAVVRANVRRMHVDMPAFVHPDHFGRTRVIIVIAERNPPGRAPQANHQNRSKR
jgi:hypothetical protein